MSEPRNNLEAAKEAGNNVFRVGAWVSMTPEEMTVWTLGYTISHPNSPHDERLCFAWGFLEAYQQKEAFKRSKEQP